MASGNASSVCPTAPVGNTVVLPAGSLAVTFIFPVGRVGWRADGFKRALLVEHLSRRGFYKLCENGFRTVLCRIRHRACWCGSVVRSLRPCPGRTGNPLLFPVGWVERRARKYRWKLLELRWRYRQYSVCVGCRCRRVRCDGSARVLYWRQRSLRPCPGRTGSPSFLDCVVLEFFEFMEGLAGVRSISMRCRGVCLACSVTHRKRYGFR